MIAEPHAETQWYLPTNVSVLFDGRWISGFEYCATQGVQIHVITASNPGDERPGSEVNDARNEQLHADISALGFDALAALGSDPNSSHSEKSWAVVGLTDNAAVELGKKYGQVAVFRITDSRQSVLGCLSEWEVSRGV